MKNIKFLIAFFVTVFTMLVSCKAPSVSKNEAYEDGAIGITVKLPAAAGRAAFTQDDAASYKIEMSLNETVVQTKTGLPGQTVTLKVEAEGLYTVTVTAYDATEREIAKGSATADLKFGDGIVPLQIKIRGYKKEIEIVPEIIWEEGEYDSRFDGRDILETAHVKVENVSGGLKFTITRPSDDCFNPHVLLKEEFVDYIRVDENGNIFCKDTDEPIKDEVDVDENGIPVFEEDVGIGNGDFIYVPHEYVGEGNGAYARYENGFDENGTQCYYFNYVSEGNGDYGPGGMKYVGKGNGNYKCDYFYNRVYGGYGYVAINRAELINGNYYWTTRAILSTRDNTNDTLECYYPLCEAGERYVFDVQIQPADFDNYPEYTEGISIVADGGIGDVEYGSFLGSTKVNLIYDGEKPIITVDNYNLQLSSYFKNIRSYYDVMVGDGKWQFGSTKWLLSYASDGIDFNIAVDPCFEDIKNYWYRWEDDGYGSQVAIPLTEEEIAEAYAMYNFKTVVENSGKDEFYVEYSFLFELPSSVNCEGIQSWRTAVVKSINSIRIY